MDWEAVDGALSGALGKPFLARARNAVGGGCFNRAWVLEGEGARYFVKANERPCADMFDAEAQGLRELGAAAVVRVPEPLCAGPCASGSFLVLEYVEFGPASPSAAEALGQGLAGIHRITRARFGWDRDNTIGLSPQPNPPCANWVDFLRRHRLGFQLDLAAKNGHGGDLQRGGEHLLERLDGFFPGYEPAPSLLHGDLWSGNQGTDRHGTPVLFDPAVYFGDREADLAMTELFGGFPPAFHAAYRESWPLDPGYPVRRTLYNLYHVLNHLNLFGGGYGAQARRMIGALLAETRA